MFTLISFVGQQGYTRRTMIITLPEKTTFDAELMQYATLLDIPNFRFVKMRDELPPKPHRVECGILNLNGHTQRGSHWTAWYKDGMQRWYFDSFGEAPPLELLTYLKTSEELKHDAPVIRRSAVIVQHYESNECGSLCLYVLKLLTSHVPFSRILSSLVARYQTFPTPHLTIKL